MKNNLHANPLLFKMMILITCFMLVILYNKSKAGELPATYFAKYTTAKNISPNFKKAVNNTSNNIDCITIYTKSYR